MKKADGYTKVTMNFLNWKGDVTDSEVIAEFYSEGWARYLLPELKRRAEESKKEATRKEPGQRIDVEIWDAKEKKFRPFEKYYIYY